jgi:putative hemin transport protein
MTSPAARALKSAWQKLQEEKGISVQREGAAALGVPEAVLQNAQAGPAVVRLRPEFAAILRELPRLGRLMTIVRNDSFVALPVGTVSDVKLDGTFGQLTGGPIDVSFDVSRWGSAFALYEESGHSVRRIFYFFDDCGDSALRVLLWSRDGQAEFDALVEGYRDPRPGDVPTTPRDKADWRSAAEFPAAHRVEDEAPRHTAALLETLTATETMVDWIVPAGASRARYVGP